MENKNKNINKNINTQADIASAIQLLYGTEISILDCVRLARNTLDFKPKKSKISDIQYCAKVLNSGLKHLHIKEMSIEKGFKLYLKSKTQLRKASFDDIKYIGKRLLKSTKYAKRNFSEMTLSDCQNWLSETYVTPSQFNKGHAMLNAFFNYALRQEWADRNVLRLVEKRKVVEKEIRALSIAEIRSLLKTAQRPQFKDCLAGVALQIWAGIRPQELTRLMWQDIDLEENIITIRPTTSKTGGARHIEICKALKDVLGKALKNTKSNLVLPINWLKKWKALRHQAGFEKWTQDVLRHTYASYHTKHFANLPLLQLNMGHHNLKLLRSRYINLHNISKIDAQNYFSVAS